MRYIHTNASAPLYGSHVNECTTIANCNRHETLLIIKILRVFENLSKLVQQDLNFTESHRSKPLPRSCLCLDRTDAKE